MKPLPDLNTPAKPERPDVGLTSSAAPRLIALHRWCRDSGIAPVTAWRYRRRGWLKTLNICGRVYVSEQAISEFLRRAKSGEFAAVPAIARRHRSVPR